MVSSLFIFQYKYRRHGWFSYITTRVIIVPIHHRRDESTVRNITCSAGVNLRTRQETPIIAYHLIDLPSLLDGTSFHRDGGRCTGIGGFNCVISVVTHGLSSLVILLYSYMYGMEWQNLKDKLTTTCRECQERRGGMKMTTTLVDHSLKPAEA